MQDSLLFCLDNSMLQCKTQILATLRDHGSMDVSDLVAFWDHEYALLTTMIETLCKYEYLDYFELDQSVKITAKGTDFLLKASVLLSSEESDNRAVA